MQKKESPDFRSPEVGISATESCQNLGFCKNAKGPEACVPCKGANVKILIKTATSRRL